MAYIFGIWGEAELILRIWGAKEKYFQGDEEISFRDALFSGIKGALIRGGGGGGGARKCRFKYKSILIVKGFSNECQCSDGRQNIFNFIMSFEIWLWFDIQEKCKIQ